MRSKSDGNLYSEDIGCRGGFNEAVGVGFDCEQVRQLLIYSVSISVKFGK